MTKSATVTKVAFNKKDKELKKKIEWIAIKNLSVVWVQSQRRLNENDVQKLVDTFDPDLFGTLAVTKPNGSGIHHIIDGQHRKTAVERLWGDPNQMLPCEVFDAHDPATAARLFDKMNTCRRPPSPLDTFKVRVTAKNELEVAVNRIVLSCGYAVGNKGETSSAKNLSCVGALKMIYAMFGGGVLQDSLNLITSIWGAEDRQATDATVIRGVAEFLSEYRSLDWKRLREVIGHKYTPSRLHGAAKSYKELHGGSMATAIKALFVATYNQGQRSGKKLVKVAPTKS